MLIPIAAQANGLVIGSAGYEGTVGTERHTFNWAIVACGCSEGYFHGIISVEREGVVVLVVKGGEMCATLGFSTSWQHFRPISYDLTVVVTSRRIISDML
jgi:hypothetical protein